MRGDTGKGVNHAVPIFYSLLCLHKHSVVRATRFVPLPVRFSVHHTISAFTELGQYARAL